MDHATRTALPIALGLLLFACGKSTTETVEDSRAGISTTTVSSDGSGTGGRGAVADDAGPAPGSGATAAANGTSTAQSGTPTYPSWVERCQASRQTACNTCTDPTCLVCIYGTAAEKSAGQARCTEIRGSYVSYCACVAEGCPATCAPPF